MTEEKEHFEQENIPEEDASAGLDQSFAEDLAVIEDILAGKTDRFRVLQKKYSRIVASLIRRMVRNQEDVEDLTQETFIKAYNALRSYQPEYQFSRWLYRIASNTCIDFLRKKRLNLISIDQPAPNYEGESQYEIPDQDETPDVILQNRERKKILDEAMSELPEKYRIIMKLRHEDELDYQEIADRLEIPLGTVKAHLFRARKLLYTKLKKHEHHFFEGE